MHGTIGEYDIGAAGVEGVNFAVVRAIERTLPGVHCAVAGLALEDDRSLEMVPGRLLFKGGPMGSCSYWLHGNTLLKLRQRNKCRKLLAYKRMQISLPGGTLRSIALHGRAPSWLRPAGRSCPKARCQQHGEHRRQRLHRPVRHADLRRW